MAKVLIVIPYWDVVHPMTHAAVTVMAVERRSLPLLVKGRPIDYARNSIVRILKAHPDYTHLFTVDQDTEPPLDALSRLLDLNTEIASGCYRLHTQEGFKWASHDCRDGKYYLQKELPDAKHPFWADAGGAGCLLIRRSVFETISWPWFRFTEHENGYQESEDVYFFKKCNAAGLRVRFDPKVLCVHHKEIGL